MLKKRITANFKAALIVIASENTSALRALLKTITNLTSKSLYVHKKS